jgi:hypothetical protein
MSDIKRRTLTFADLKSNHVSEPDRQPEISHPWYLESQPISDGSTTEPVESPAPSTPSKERTEAQRARKRQAREKANPRLAMEEMDRLQTMLREKYPAVFKTPPVVPLAYGVDRQIMAEQGLTMAQVRSALGFWINGIRYLTAIARGGSRYSLDGKTDGVVTDAEAAAARTRLAARKPWHPGGKHERWHWCTRPVQG